MLTRKTVLPMLLALAAAFPVAAQGGFEVTTAAPGGDTTVEIDVQGTTATDVTVVKVDDVVLTKDQDYWVVGSLPAGTFTIEFATAPAAGAEVEVKGSTSGNSSEGYDATADWDE
jgi:hypothetical protein